MMQSIGSKVFSRALPCNHAIQKETEAMSIHVVWIRKLVNLFLENDSCKWVLAAAIEFNNNSSSRLVAHTINSFKVKQQDLNNGLFWTVSIDLIKLVRHQMTANLKTLTGLSTITSVMISSSPQIQIVKIVVVIVKVDFNVRFHTCRNRMKEMMESNRNRMHRFYCS